MEGIWNNAELPMPPLKTVHVKKIRFDLFELKEILHKAIDFYECQINYSENGKLCSQLIAKRNASFKHFKGFQDMCKANTALRRLNKVSILNVLKNFIGLLPESMFTLELPPKVNLDYLLLRTIAYHKLLVRISYCCKCAVAYFVRILRNNFFMDTLSLFLSVLSKIWYDGIILAKFTAKLYSDLKKYLPLMPRQKIKHCFDDFVYPIELEETTIEELDKEKEKATKKSVITMKERVQKSAETSNSYSISQSSLDLGEVISRTSLLPSIDLDKKQQKQFDNQTIKNKKTSVKDNKISKTIQNLKVKPYNSDKEKIINKDPLVPSINQNKEKIFVGPKKKKNLKKSNVVAIKEHIKKTKENSINVSQINKSKFCLEESLIDVSKIKTIEEVQKILRNENTKRKQFKQSLLTKKLSDEQWSQIRKKIMQKIKSGNTESAIKIFKKFLKKSS